MAKQKFVTPVGEVKFPQIAKPDSFNKYRISLVFDPKDEAFGKLIADLDAAEQEVDKKFRGKGHYKKNIDLVDGEKVETDKVIMQFNSSFPLWDEKGCKIYDSNGKPVETDIGWGSKCRVSFTLLPYDVSGKTGITKYIAGIQIIDLKLQGASAEGCGFGAVEGGFTAQPSPSDNMTEEEKAAAIEANQIAWDD